MGKHGVTTAARGVGGSARGVGGSVRGVGGGPACGFCLALPLFSLDPRWLLSWFWWFCSWFRWLGSVTAGFGDAKTGGNAILRPGKFKTDRQNTKSGSRRAAFVLKASVLAVWGGDETDIVSQLAARVVILKSWGLAQRHKKNDCVRHITEKERNEHDYNSRSGAHGPCKIHSVSSKNRSKNKSVRSEKWTACFAAESSPWCLTLLVWVMTLGVLGHPRVGHNKDSSQWINVLWICGNRRLMNCTNVAVNITKPTVSREVTLWISSPTYLLSSDVSHVQTKQIRFTISVRVHPQSGHIDGVGLKTLDRMHHDDED